MTFLAPPPAGYSHYKWVEVTSSFENLLVQSYRDGFYNHPGLLGSLLGNLLTTTDGRVRLVFSLRRPPETGCSPGRGDLQAQCEVERLGKGVVCVRRASGGRSCRARTLIRRSATFAEETGDRGGKGPAGDAGVVPLPVLPLGAAVVL